MMRITSETAPYADTYYVDATVNEAVDKIISDGYRSNKSITVLQDEFEILAFGELKSTEWRKTNLAIDKSYGFTDEKPRNRHERRKIKAQQRANKTSVNRH